MLHAKKGRFINSTPCNPGAYEMNDQNFDKTEGATTVDVNNVKKISPEKKELKLREIEAKHNINLIARVEEEGLEKVKKGASPADLLFLENIQGKDLEQVVQDLNKGDYSFRQ